MIDYRKKKRGSKACWLMFCIFLAACTPKQENRIVARVNQEEILLSDLHDRLKEYQFDATLNTPEKNFELKKNVLNELIQEIIVSQVARENQIQVDPLEIEKVVQMTVHKEDLNNPNNLAEIERLKTRIRRQITATNLYTWVTKDITPPLEEELKAYYDARPEEFIQEEQIRIQQIIVKEKDQAQKILAELKQEVPFQDLVNTYSVLPQSTLEGDTGFVSRGMFEPELEDKIYKLKQGQISPIIETENGFHIVKVLGKKASKTLTFDEVRDFIFENLLQQKKEKHYTKWLEQKILQTSIERNHAILQQNTPIS